MGCGSALNGEPFSDALQHLHQANSLVGDYIQDIPTVTDVEDNNIHLTLFHHPLGYRRHHWMSSRSSYQCSEEPQQEYVARQLESLKAHIHLDYLDHLGRRKVGSDTFLIAVLKDTPQLIALLVAALCAGIIQTYTPASDQIPPSSDAALYQTVKWLGSTHFPELRERLGFVCRWAKDNLAEVLRNVPTSEALKRGIVRLLTTQP